uniref:HSF-type DNA-binding domain-containing protein n=1 Tax=Echeneis naucrates TaxID=173247 RepID=A0A665U7P4_ECHNA
HEKAPQLTVNCDSMDADDSSLPESINRNNFPAKLWRLVNNPVNKAIFWDSLGEVVIIDQKLFEMQILSPTSTASDNAFKTNNFSSFVRQLNLYGFRKADPGVRDRHHASGHSATYHYFYNPNFQQDRPELVARLRRLTVDNKAKLQAGLNVNCRPPSRYLRQGGADDGKDVKRGKCPCLRSWLWGKRGIGNTTILQLFQGSTHPYYPCKGQATTTQSATPIPPRYLIRDHGAALSPSVFHMDKGIPLSLSHHYSGVAPISTAENAPQSLVACANHGNPHVTSFNSSNVQFQPGYQPPGEQYVGS